MDEKIEQKVRHLLKEVVDPNTGKDLVASKSVKKIEDVDDKLKILIDLDYPAKTQIPVVKNLVEAKLAENHIEADVEVKQNIIAHQVQRGVKVFDNVRNVIAVSSGKGGVGKSTVAANLALALQAEGAKVGLLDADIYGPSQPTMLGLKGGAVTKDGKTLEPLDGHGLQVASIGVLIDPDEPMIWRGPLAVSALQQLIKQTNWHDLDYLIVDMPPGTGDIQLSLSQEVPLTGAIVVTTPQDIALMDAKKGLVMFEKVNVPILGIIENMATHICSKCGHEEHIFGEGGAKKMAEQYGVKFLGEIPLDINIRLSMDKGEPIVEAAPDSKVAQVYKEIARKVGVLVSERNKDYSAKMPSIKVSND
ncbi:iron-sulfur cluster carrier protein ApbC [Turicimonas muris]|uniref:Iron-sulfur cluster carrier protein n=1 Tax=Turicimonas muris TaxID=1796652 RepID=A0A227KDT1_9BURK|nr:iron-sulfur cluster carrier protein ApbC [Turicimonas muris]ANU66456.1 Fe-S-binding ATPase [Burkholderiales bacterium YL45]OXE45586.1 Fe-S-binding ATPase [Turicimonas muris]QQQ97603.1 iron-sulfur cluster carrier protein ApbC [Turicimonas muris]